MSATSARVAQQSPGRMRATSSQTFRSSNQHQIQQESFIFEDDAGDIVEFEDPYEDVDVDKVLQSFQDELEALNHRWKQVGSHISLAYMHGRSVSNDGTPSRNRDTPITSRKTSSDTPRSQSKENQSMSAFNSTATKSHNTPYDEKYETPRLVPTYTTYTTDSKAPYSIKDPPPSAERYSPLRNYVDNSTPVRKEKGGSSARSYSTRRSVETPAEPPPAPVETPHPASYATPNRQRRERPPRTGMDPQDDILSQLKAALEEQERKVQSLEQENHVLKEHLHDQSENGRDRLLFASEFGSISSNLRLNLDENAAGTTTTNVKHTPPAQAPPPPTPINSRRDSDYEIRDESYRGHRRTMDSSGIPPSIPRREDDVGGYGLPPKHDHRLQQAYEPLGRRPIDTPHDDVSSYRPSPISTPARNPTSPPKRVHISSTHGGSTMHANHHQQTTTTTTTLGAPAIPEEELWVSEGLSRGTRFVAKLSALMDVQPGHQAPMSVLVDKHWDELKYFFESSS